MGYPNRQSFWRAFDAWFHESAQVVYIRKKMDVLQEYLKANPGCKSKDAALAIHHKNGNELHQFVTTKFGCSPTELKKRICGNDSTD